MARQPAPNEAARNPVPARMGEARYWYDGERRRDVRVDLEIVVERDPTAASLEQIEEALPGAEPVAERPGTRIWRLTGTSGDAIAKFQAANPGAHYARAYRENGARDGSLRTTTGKIVVALPRDWSEPELTQWMAENGLTLDRRLPLRDPIYSFSVGAADPIAVANRIHEAGVVKWAQPDWWTGVVRK